MMRANTNAMNNVAITPLSSTILSAITKRLRRELFFDDQYRQPNRLNSASATFPHHMRGSPRQPCEPTAMTSARHSAACSRIISTGSPRIARLSVLFLPDAPVQSLHAVSAKGWTDGPLRLTRAGRRPCFQSRRQPEDLIARPPSARDEKSARGNRFSLTLAWRRNESLATSSCNVSTGDSFPDNRFCLLPSRNRSQPVRP